jgi:hypothetical protein
MEFTTTYQQIFDSDIMQKTAFLQENATFGQKPKYRFLKIAAFSFGQNFIKLQP